jgi:hypothetical protein
VVKDGAKSDAVYGDILLYSHQEYFWIFLVFVHKWVGCASRGYDDQFMSGEDDP